MPYYFEENAWGERFIPDINRDSFLSMRSSEYYRTNLESNLSAKNTLHVVIGSDSGLLLKYFLDNLTGEGSCAVIIEHDEVSSVVNDEYKDILTQTKENDLDVPQVTLLNSSDWQSEIFKDIYNSWFLGGTIKIVQAHCCEMDYDNRYFTILRESRRAIAEHQVNLNQALGSKMFVEAQFSNAADNYCPCPASSLFGKDRVAVVLAGGPSLEEHIDWVTANRKKLFIIALSRLCGKLELINVIPDLVVSIDPQPLMYDVSRQGVLWKDVPLISGYHLAPELLQQWQGPRYFIGDRLPWDESFGRSSASIRNTGPTAGHTAVIVASQLGFTTILMAGVDLCFSSVGNTHVDGTPEAVLRSLPSGYDAQVETYSGRLAGTSMVLLRTIKAMDELGKGINQFKPVLFNLSEEAAKLDSIPLIEKKNVRLKEDRPNFIMNFEYLASANSLRDLNRELHSAKHAYLDILDLSNKAFKCIDHIYERNGKQGNASHRKRLDTIEKKLQSQHPVYVKTLKYYASQEFARLDLPSGFESMNKEQMESWIVDYYTLIRNSATSLIKCIKCAQKKVKLRQDELVPNHPLTDLIERWRDDNTPGRILTYQKQHGDSLLNGQHDLMDVEIEQFLGTMQEDDEFSKEIISSTSRLINDCIKSVMFLFHKNNDEELNTLSQGITNLSWPNDALVQFINGLKAEITDDKLSAVSCYQEVIDLCSEKLHSEATDIDTVGHLIESTLVRLSKTYLADNNGQSALEALGILSELSPYYICSYAKLLSLLDQSDSATELLQLYLQNYPKDWRAAQQLSECYSKLGATESAKLAKELAESTRHEKNHLQIRVA